MTAPLFQPLTIRHVTFRNRFMSTSHACGLEEGGMPKERYQRYHEEKAKGGIGLTMFGGSSNVAPDSPSVFQQLYVGDDEVIPYLKQFSERVHKHGAAIHAPWTTRRAVPGALAAHHRPVRHSRNVTSKFSERNGRSRYRPRGQGIRRRGATMQGRRLPSTTRCASAM